MAPVISFYSEKKAVEYADRIGGVIVVDTVYVARTSKGKIFCNSKSKSKVYYVGKSHIDIEGQRIRSYFG